MWATRTTKTPGDSVTGSPAQYFEIYLQELNQVLTVNM